MSIDIYAVEELLTGAVDLYVHAAPDLLPRASDDAGVAMGLQTARLQTAIHRHHFEATGGRSRHAREATGFDLRGAIILNTPAGALDPAATERALREGVAWVGLPTLSAQHCRPQLNGLPAAALALLDAGDGGIRLLDAHNELRGEVNEIFALVAQHGAVLGLGYGDFDEIHAAARASQAAGVKHRVLTYPRLSGLADTQITALLDIPGTWLELCGYGIHPHGAARDWRAAQQDFFHLLTLAGTRRCLLSSDGGMLGCLPPHQLLQWSCGQLLEAGLTHDEVTRLIKTNPRAILEEKFS
ncbi:MAG: DUF6282 family protein [Spongiibacteraceae bacterium]